MIATGRIYAQRPVSFLQADGARAASRTGNDPPSETTLQRLNARLKQIVEDQTRGKLIRVRGMAWNVRRSSMTGHVHFMLRDNRHSLPCVVLRGLARQLPFEIEDGQQVLVEGQVEVYKVWGELQLLARAVELDKGAAEQETLSSLKARAEAEGWLEPDRKRPLPSSPKTIGLITGGGSKARADVRGSLQDAGIECTVLPATANMEGPEAAPEIRAALDTLNEHPSEVDLIVIARGGASTTRLWAFNDWELARNIVHSRAPVLTAIGHRQDETLADLVADARAHTPSTVDATLTKDQPEEHNTTPAKDQPKERDAAPVEDQPKEGDVTLAVALVVVAVIALIVIARVLGWL